MPDAESVSVARNLDIEHGVEDLFLTARGRRIVGLRVRQVVGVLVGLDVEFDRQRFARADGRIVGKWVHRYRGAMRDVAVFGHGEFAGAARGRAGRADTQAFRVVLGLGREPPDVELNKLDRDLLGDPGDRHPRP